MAINGLQLPSSHGFTPDITPTLANLVNTINAGQKQQQIAQTLSSLQPGPNGQIDPTPLLKSGNMSLAQLGIGILNNQTAQARDARDFAFRQTEAQRAQGNADRSFGLQSRAADRADEDKFTPVKITNPDGTTSTGAFNPRTGQTTMAPGQTSQPTNPYSYGKQNENQSKDSGYANRLFRAEGVLRDPKSIAAAESLYQRGLDNLPMGVGNYLQSSDYQRYDQAARDFVNAVLRRESGAAINQSEFDNAYRQYLPRPGDSKEVLAEKQRNRIEAIKGIAGGGGPNYRPPFTFGENGQLVPAQAKQSGTITQEQYNALPSGTPYTAPDGSQRVKR